MVASKKFTWYWNMYSEKFLVLNLQVVLLQEVEGDKAEELVKKCPVKVFDIKDIGKGWLTNQNLVCFQVTYQGGNILP